MVAYPWAVSGQYLAALTGIPDSAQDKAADGIAYAFRPGGAYVRLGPAIAIYAASQPGRFWLRSASFRGPTLAALPHHCTLTEITAEGRRIAGPLAAPCERWIIAAVPGGFVSVPTAMPNAARMPAVRTWDFGLGGGYQLSPETPVQLWNPASGKVARTYGIDPRWIDGASDQYLAWQDHSQTGPHVSSVEVTNLSTGKTSRIGLPVSAGDFTWRDPILAPHGPYLAWMELTRATWRKFSMEAPSAAGGAPGLPGAGRIKILDFAAGHVILNRKITIAWAGAFDWSPDSRYLFVAASYTNLSVVPTWSGTAHIRNLQLPIRGLDGPDTQQLVVALRTESH
jgi:hypothetical protein